MLKKPLVFDVVVVGAGHAGLEAAFICAKRGLKVCLISLDQKAVALMPCNPSIGGPAKGIVTREIDALGGMQGKIADQCQFQMKLLNISKGPGVQALRAQIDKIKYQEVFNKEIKNNKNIQLFIDEVSDIIVKDKVISGVSLAKYGMIKVSQVILACGTYISSVTHIGKESNQTGPQGLPTANKIINFIQKLQLRTMRFKTGTPPRIKQKSINFKRTQIELGTDMPLCFSHYAPTYLEFSKQIPCYLTYTNKQTHKIIQDNLHLSAMYSGIIKGVGPRYCPSIEDKVVRFSQRDRHQIFIEPESIQLETMYLQGLSSSLPKDAQEKFVHSIEGLEKAVFDKYAYAIEYLVVDPTQLLPTLECKKVKGLYFAGQINGTSGYEEAAAQGLISGINVINRLKKMKPLIMDRKNSYIGVLIDDIVTKGVNEPYRLLTSRAEYRLSIRNDNALERLFPTALSNHLLNEKEQKIGNSFFTRQKKLLQYLSVTPPSPTMKKKHGINIKNLYELVKRNDITCFDVLNKQQTKIFGNDVIANVNSKIKLAGYIVQQNSLIERFNTFEKVSLKKIVNYNSIPNISVESREKLNKIMPLTLGQAQRISGVTIVDLINIKYYLDNHG